MKDTKPFKWGLLALLALAQFMVVLDSSIVNVALPAIQKALNFSSADLQWVVTAYTLAFGGFLLLGGRAADLYGRRKMFILGVAGFTLASVLVGFSQSSLMMILGRGLQGLSAAIMSPAALSIVLTNFNEGKARNTALGVWGAVAAGGAAAGLLFGGLLTQYASWEWNFFVNVPVGIAVIIAALKVIPTHEQEEKENSLDLPGAVLVTGGLMTLVYALVKAPEWGWTDGTSLSLFAVTIAMLAGFIWNESRAKHPLVPLSIFRIRNVTGANLVQLPLMASLMAMFFFLSLYIQSILQYSPVMTGVSFLPVTVIIAIVATTTGQLVAKVGFKPILTAAPIFMGIGLFLLTHISVNGAYWTDVFPGLALIALGAGMSFVALTIAATAGVPGREAGLASGLINTSQQIGGALGLAILSGVAASKIEDVMRHSAPTAQALATATVEGYKHAFLVAVGFTVISTLLVIFVLKAQKTAGGEQPIAMH